MWGENMAKYWHPDDRDKKITTKQIALLHVAKTKLSLTESDYRSVLSLYGGAESAKELSLEGFSNVMNYLKRVGFANASRKVHQRSNSPNSNPDDLPYPAQLKKMQDLFHALGMDAAERQQGFCKRVIKAPWAQTKADASKIIEGLKAMLYRQEKSL